MGNLLQAFWETVFFHDLHVLLVHQYWPERAAEWSEHEKASGCSDVVDVWGIDGYLPTIADYIVSKNGQRPDTE
jgi:hypothetical protein